MIEFLLSMDLNTWTSPLSLSAAKHLRIHHVADDGLIFSGKIFIQQFGETVATDLVFICDGLRFGHLAFSLSIKVPCR